MLPPLSWSRLILEVGLIPKILDGLAASLQLQNSHLAPLVDLIEGVSYLRDNCNQLMIHGLLQRMPQLLSNHKKTDQLIRILWNLLENCTVKPPLSSSSVSIDLCLQNDETIKVHLEEKTLAKQLAKILVDIFVVLLKEGNKQEDKELRNEVVIVMMLLAKEAAFKASLLDEQMLVVAVDVLKSVHHMGCHTSFQSISITDQDSTFELASLVCSLTTSLCLQQGGLQQAMALGELCTHLRT